MPDIWLPKIGDLVKLNRFDLYTSRQLAPWAWLKVEENIHLGDKYMIRLRVMNGGIETDRTISADAIELERPLGWRKVYPLYTSEEQEPKVREWMRSRGGIAIWASHDLSCAGRLMFTPGDRISDGKPHWSVELVEVVTDPKRIKMMREIWTDTKPDKSQKPYWKYDRSAHGWYRDIELSPLEDIHGASPSPNEKI